MDVCGEGLNIQRSHVMRLAQTGGLDQRWAVQRLDGMLGVVGQWRANWSVVSTFDSLPLKPSCRRYKFKHRFCIESHLSNDLDGSPHVTFLLLQQRKRLGAMAC
jgi:hypothetical protein